MQLLRLGVLTSTILLMASCGADERSQSLDPSARTRPVTVPATAHPPSSLSTQAGAVTRCEAKALALDAGRESDGSHIAASATVEITNLGPASCRLGGVPTVAILRPRGGRPAVTYSVAHHVVLRPAVLPVATPQAAAIHLAWLNWCGAKLGPLRIKVTLPDGEGTAIAPFNGPPAYDVVPGCGSRELPSTLELLSAYASGG